ncbi:hypothetical protein NDU88_007202 [Pleurodeles waltl]|uniref:Uncharacterized protein n=1 Tax=Pleurodeles waltl TaxID=8319 RepID=A0AAV7RSG5_PLEWA|nr:hypothetical protein NDU88_007202 [Pleurodeles waltl]
MVAKQTTLSFGHNRDYNDSRQPRDLKSQRYSGSPQKRDNLISCSLLKKESWLRVKRETGIKLTKVTVAFTAEGL